MIYIFPVRKLERVNNQHLDFPGCQNAREAVIHAKSTANSRQIHTKFTPNPHHHSHKKQYSETKHKKGNSHQLGAVSLGVGFDCSKHVH
jgi:hypothetical protein